MHPLSDVGLKPRNITGSRGFDNDQATDQILLIAFITSEPRLYWSLGDEADVS
jgi:hypothetical protein